MGLVINSQSIQKDWTFTEDKWKLQGNSQHNGTTGAITNFNCQISKINGELETYAGNANGYKNGEELKVNLNDMATADMAEASQVVEDLIAALSPVD